MQRPPIEIPVGFKLADIYYILFRRKWLIGGFIAAGAITALVVGLLQKPLYFSEAKLLLRYVVDTKSVEASVGTQVQAVNYGAESIINSELEILTSLDLCEEVATLVGPEKILFKGSSNVTAAAGAVYNGLSVENPRRSNIIKIRFVHPDPAMCQTVMRQLVETYFKRHKEVHRAAGSYDDLLTQQAQQLLVRIRQNEEELRNLKSKANVGSLDDAKKNLTDQVSRLRQEIFEAQAQLAENQALLGSSPAKASPDTNNVTVPADKLAEYKSLLSRVDFLRSKEFDLVGQYTEEHPQVIQLRQQVADVEKRRKAMEKEFPSLADTYTPPSPSALSAGDSRPDPRRTIGLETKIRLFTNQLASVHAEIVVLDSLESAILDVERKLKLDRQNYLHMAAGVETARFDEALSAGKMSNIQPVQTPSPAAPNVSKRLKAVAGTFFGFLVVGLALAFGYELLIDHTVRRPTQFETKFKMPLFLTIPKIGLNGHAKKLPLATQAGVVANAEGTADPLRETWAPDHPLRPFVDGLRDRTLIHFGTDPHKPKLIGVTGCSNGSGVTSMAAGLAGALSETGDGNVLLLNLNFDSQAVHPFYRGELACGLTDALEVQKRDHGKVLNNLYVATAGNPADPDVQNLSKQLARIVPKLRVSDYDYIVFDLPPTTPTTPTARLSGMMDLVILVVEAGKDTHDSVKQAGQLLARAKAPVSAVLNKVNNPVPKWLHSGTEVISS